MLSLDLAQPFVNKFDHLARVPVIVNDSRHRRAGKLRVALRRRQFPAHSHKKFRLLAADEREQRTAEAFRVRPVIIVIVVPYLLTCHGPARPYPMRYALTERRIGLRDIGYGLKTPMFRECSYKARNAATSKLAVH
jgi:hypothetical protein